MVDAASLQVAAEGGADHHGRRECAVGAVAYGGQFVADLHERRPDVIEELNFDDGLESARRHPDRAPHDVRLGERRVEDAVAAETPLEPVRHLEDATLALHLCEGFLARRVGHVLAEHDDARVPLHLVAQAAVDEVYHRQLLAARLEIR